MGRYIIDNPEPPTAMEQLRGNLGKVANFYLQQKMADIERKKKLEEDIAAEQRKNQAELELLREKSNIETKDKEALLGRILGNTSGENSVIPEGFKPKGFNYEGISFERNPSDEEKIAERSNKLSDEIAKKELSSMATNLPKLDQAFQSIDQLEKLYNKGATPDVNPLIARTSGVADAIRAKMGFNPELNSYINNSKAFAGLIAKGGFGEAGMLTNQDIARVIAALPTSMSTPEEARIGFTEIKKLLSAARERFESTKKSYLFGNMSSPNPTQPVFGGQSSQEISPESARQELIRRGVLKQGGAGGSF